MSFPSRKHNVLDFQPLQPKAVARGYTSFTSYVNYYALISQLLRTRHCLLNRPLQELTPGPYLERQ